MQLAFLGEPAQFAGGFLGIAQVEPPFGGEQEVAVRIIQRSHGRFLYCGGARLAKSFLPRCHAIAPVPVLIVGLGSGAVRPSAAAVPATTLAGLGQQLNDRLVATRAPGATWSVSVVALGSGKTFFSTNASRLPHPRFGHQSSSRRRSRSTASARGTGSRPRSAPADSPGADGVLAATC